MIEKISVNREIFKTSNALVHANNGGLMYGLGAFETFRVSGGKVFLYNEHIKRLDRSLSALGIRYVPDTGLKSHIVKLCESLDENDGLIRLMVTSGESNSPLSVGSKPTEIIYFSPINKFKPTSAPAKIIKSIRRHKPEYFNKTNFRIKSLDYAPSVIAKEELGESEIGILLSPEGYVAEALTANIFWTKESKIFTSPLSLGILSGTMRSVITGDFDVEEKLVTSEQLIEADEIIFTSGASYLISANSIEGILKPGESGAIYQAFIEKLKMRISQESVDLKS